MADKAVVKIVRGWQSSCEDCGWQSNIFDTGKQARVRLSQHYVVCSKPYIEQINARREAQEADARQQRKFKITCELCDVGFTEAQRNAIAEAIIAGIDYD